MSRKAGHWAVIPAAGAGKRFGSAVPKQYLEMCGQRVIDHSIGLFLRHPLISGCVVALSAGDEWWPTCRYANDPNVKRAAGGAERSDSVRNALLLLSEFADDDDWVLVHDAARPCLSRSDLDRLLDALRDESVGALLAVPVHDTVKSSSERDPFRVGLTLSRTHMWRAFTPQAFRLGTLRAALEHVRQQGLAVTDDASAIELMGLHPRLVEGRSDNLKITRPEDLALAQFHAERQALEPQS